MKTALRQVHSKIEQAVRLAYLHSLTSVNDSVLVVEYPKSGGTWLSQLISGYLGIPFPRNRIPGLGRSVFHGHYRPSPAILRNPKILFLVRDGRDVLVSFYHHQLIWNEKNRKNPAYVDYHRKNCGFGNFENVRENMSKFISYAYNASPSRIRHFTHPGNWYDYNTAWLEASQRDGVYLLKYEDLLEDTEGTLREVFTSFFALPVDDVRLREVVDQFSFENQTKRKPGESDASSFLRKGISGDWKNYFDSEALARFDSLNGSLLETLGYESC